MLKVCLVFDCEGFISFKQGNPRWNFYERIKGRINSLIKNLRYNKEGYRLIKDFIIRENFPATFMLVGKLFRPEKNGIEYGYHSLNHIPLTLANNDIVKRETKNIFRARSFSPPLWMVEDIKNPGRIFKILEQQEYKNIIYRGKDSGIKHWHHFDIKKPEKRGKLKLIHVSNWVEGNSKLSHVYNVLKEIESNKDKDAVYCITSHDFTHKNLKNLRLLTSRLEKMGKDGKIKIMKVGDIK